MIENKVVILQSRIEQLEAEKAELMEFIKKLCEFAEGFGYIDYVLSQSSDLEQVRFNNVIFPLLIHRAVEGWNKQDNEAVIFLFSDNVLYHKLMFNDDIEKKYDFKNYQPENLTVCELACLDCLREVLK